MHLLRHPLLQAHGHNLHIVLVIRSPFLQARSHLVDARRRGDPSVGESVGRRLLQLPQRFLDLLEIRQLSRVVAGFGVADDPVLVDDERGPFGHAGHAEVLLG